MKVLATLASIAAVVTAQLPGMDQNMMMLTYMMTGGNGLLGSQHGGHGSINAGSLLPFLLQSGNLGAAFDGGIADGSNPLLPLLLMSGLGGGLGGGGIDGHLLPLLMPGLLGGSCDPSDPTCTPTQNPLLPLMLLGGGNFFGRGNQQDDYYQYDQEYEMRRAFEEGRRSSQAPEVPPVPNVEYDGQVLPGAGNSGRRNRQYKWDAPAV